MEDTGIVAIVGIVVGGVCFLAWLYVKSREPATVTPVSTVSARELEKWGIPR